MSPEFDGSMEASQCKYLIKKAWQNRIVIPSIHVSCTPMMQPIVHAVADADSYAFIAPGRLEAMRIDSEIIDETYKEYEKCANPHHISLHLGHIPATDHNGKDVPAGRIGAKGMFSRWLLACWPGKRSRHLRVPHQSADKGEQKQASDQHNAHAQRFVAPQVPEEVAPTLAALSNDRALARGLCYINRRVGHITASCR